MSMRTTGFLFLLILGNFITLYSQEPAFSKFGSFYKDTQSNIVYMPLGKISFADSVVSYTQGFPGPIAKFTDPQQSLHEPDYTSYTSPEYVSLGCGGMLVLQFKDNGFIDMPGDDLYFFEVGPSIEPFDVEISTDGKKWKKVGPLEGGSSSIDIASAEKGLRQIYYFVRITDLKSFCPGETAGADIDAVGTVSGVFKISLNADVLFDTDKYNLKKKPTKILEDLSKDILEIGDAEILIEGHTDSDGSIPYNIVLSENRANSVANKLNDLLWGKGEYSYTIKGYGEAKPTATNETATGKQQNRRVEIVVLPDEKFYEIPERE